MNPTIQDRETRIRTDTRSPASSTRDSVTFSDPSGLPLTTAATAPPLRAVLRNPQRCHLLDQVPQTGLRHTWTMDQTSITAAGVIDTFLVLLIGIGPKLALVPFLEITASFDPATKRRVLRQMLVTAAAVAVALMALGELLRALLHFTIGSLSIAGGVILLVLAVWMVLSPRPRAAATAPPGRPDAAGAVPLGGAVPPQPGGHRWPGDDLG